MFAKLMHDALCCLQRMLVLSLFILGWPLSGVVHASDQKTDWIVEVFAKDDNVEVTGALLKYTVKVTNSPTATATAKKTEIAILIPAGSQLVGALADANCTPLQSDLTAKPSTVHVTVTCEVPVLIPGESFELPIVLQTRTQQRVITLTATMSEDDSDAGNNSNQIATSLDAGADIQVAGPGLMKVPSGGISTFEFKLENLGPFDAGSTKFTLPVPPGLSITSLPAGCELDEENREIVCSIEGLSIGEEISLTFAGQVTVAGNSTLSGTGSVISQSPDSDAGNNSGALELKVTSGTDMKLSKTRAPEGILVIGDTATFTLSPTYSGSYPGQMTITDTLPDHYTEITLGGKGGWDCEIIGQTLSCTKPQSPAGAAGDNTSVGDIIYTAQVEKTGQDVTNQAEITNTGNPEDQNDLNNTATDGGADLQEPKVDLKASKLGPVPNLMVVGNKYGFPLSAENIGNTKYIGKVTIVDNLPAGMEYLGVEGAGWKCTTAPLNKTVGPLAIECISDHVITLEIGQTTPQLTLLATATKTNTAAFSNQMTVSDMEGANHREPDDLKSNNTAFYRIGATATAADSADIQIEKSVGQAEVNAGQQQDFTLTVTNNGPLPATNIQIKDRLTGINVVPNVLDYVDVPEGCVKAIVNSVSTAVDVTCTISSLAKDASQGIKLTIKNVGGDSLAAKDNVASRTNSATAYSQNVPDKNHLNNAAKVDYKVIPRVDVTLQKSASPTKVAAGQDLTYTITATNEKNGLSAAQNVIVSDKLPAGVRFISATPSTGSCDQTPTADAVITSGSLAVECNLGTLNNGVAQTVTIVVRPTNDLRGKTIENSAIINTTTLPETNDSNNTSQTTSTPVKTPFLDLRIKKTGPSTTTFGEDLEYTLVVKNAGPSASENVVITDVLPASVTYKSHKAPGAECVAPRLENTGTLTCKYKGFDANTEKTITLTVTPDTAGAVKNTANVTSDEIKTDQTWESTLDNNDDAHTVTVLTLVDLAVTKAAFKDQGFTKELTGSDPDTVNLHDDFFYKITVENTTGTQDGVDFGEASSVRITDTLPVGMNFTADPTFKVVSGTVKVNGAELYPSSPAQTCVSSGKNLTCDLTSMSSGAKVIITVPVEQSKYPAHGKVENTAKVAASGSTDRNNKNDTATADFTIGSSSIAGSVFVDFANDAVDKDTLNKAATDKGIQGVELTLTGTTHDGKKIGGVDIAAITATTDADGHYIFANIPAGTYEITRGAIEKADKTSNVPLANQANYLSDAKSISGNNSGVSYVEDPTKSRKLISEIRLPAATKAHNYYFTLTSQPRVGLAKAVSNPVYNADGSFDVTFTLKMENLSLEPLSRITITDDLSGFGRLGGNTDLIKGEYKLISLPKGAAVAGCEGAFRRFNGTTRKSVLNNAYRGDTKFAAGQTCTVVFKIRIFPADDKVTLADNKASAKAIYTNTANVSATAELSGQKIQDASTKGPNPDPNDNGSADDEGEDTATPVKATYAPTITLTKTAASTAVPGPKVGDKIEYTFTVENTGPFDLSNVVVTDKKTDLVTDFKQITSLENSQSDRRNTASYTVKQSDIDDGKVVNTANVTANGPYQTVAKASGQAQTTLTRTPALTLEKTATYSGATSAAIVGQSIGYTFTVKNTGNVTLKNVVVTDQLKGLIIGGIKAHEKTLGTMAPGSEKIFTATYVLTQGDIDAGQVENTATVTGTPPSGTSLNTVSDRTDSTTTMLTQNKSVEIIKTAEFTLNTPPMPGDVIKYTFEVKNNGNVTLKNVYISDPLPNLKLGGPTNSGGYFQGTEAFKIASLLPGKSLSSTSADAASKIFTATYALTEADLYKGKVKNTAKVTTTGPQGHEITHTDTADTTGLTAEPAITLTKKVAFSQTPAPATPKKGDEVTYTFTVKNTGNVTLKDVVVTDPHDNLLIDGKTTGKKTLGTMAPGSDPKTFTAIYLLKQEDIDAGVLKNTAKVAASDKTTAIPFDKNAMQAQAMLPLAQSPSMSLEKTAILDDLTKEKPNAGEKIAYSFKISNTGNVTLKNLYITDALSGFKFIEKDFVGKSPQSPLLSLAPQDVYTLKSSTGNVENIAVGHYALKQSDIDTQSVSNTATVHGQTPSDTAPPGVDATIKTDFAHKPSITLKKTANALIRTVDDKQSELDLAGPPQPGDRIKYTFEIKNTGNVTLTKIKVADETATVSGGPIESLAPAETHTAITALSQPLTQRKIDSGTFTNTAKVSALTPDGNPLEQTDQMTASDTTKLAYPAMTLKKAGDFSQLNTPPRAGDIVTYTLTVTNTGNVTLKDVVVTDPLDGLIIDGLKANEKTFEKMPPTRAGSVQTFKATYALTQSDIDGGNLQNTARLAANNSLDDAMSPVSSETVSMKLEQTPAITLKKTDDYKIEQAPIAGTTKINYTFAVKNTGNVTLYNIVIYDPLKDLRINGVQTKTHSIGTLSPDDEKQIKADYTLKQDDIETGSRDNKASVSATTKSKTDVDVAAKSQDALAKDNCSAAAVVTDCASVKTTIMTVEANPEVFESFSLPGGAPGSASLDGGVTSTMLESDRVIGLPATLYSGGDKKITDVTITVIENDPGVTLDTTTGLITLAKSKPAGDYIVKYRICSVIVPTKCADATESVNQLPIPGIVTRKSQKFTDNGDGHTGIGDLLTYTIEVENIGNVPLTDVSLTDEMTSLAGNALVLDQAPTFGSATQGSKEGALKIGETARYSAKFTLTKQAVIDGGTRNIVTASGNSVHGPTVVGAPQGLKDVSDDPNNATSTFDDPTDFIIQAVIGDLRLTVEKTTPKDLIERGAIVPYSIIVKNQSPVVIGPIDLFDVLPSDFLFIENSATLNSQAHAVDRTGKTVIWRAITLPPNDKITLTLKARVLSGALPGEHINVAQAYDPARNILVSNKATAAVRILPDHAFDCGEVLGKVFDDENLDGYPNAGEPGIAGARLMTVDGSLITADSFGRFHVPCAVLPDRNGTNYSLKLDTNSLPTGYRVTTENPRVVRLTRGKISKLNFGAAIAKLVRLDVNRKAFVRSETAPTRLSKILEQTLNELARKYQKTPLHLRVVYHVDTAAGPLKTRRASQDIKHLKRQIRRIWQRNQNAKLTLETTIFN